MSDQQLRELERKVAGGDHANEPALRHARCRSGQCCNHAPPLNSKAFKVPSLPTLWYENEDGERWVPPSNYNGYEPPPEGFIYQHSRFASQLRDSILKIVQSTEVIACSHPEDQVRPTGGWIEGIEGRECHACNGTQTRELPAPWPEEWDSHGSRQVLAMNTGWSKDLVTTLVKKGTDIGDAIIFSAVACEKCMNIAAHKVGLEWGYTEDSEDAAKAGTTCEICVPANYLEE